MTYIATFFSHFAAIHFSRMLKEQDIYHQLMPVPRKLSSSCGTCVRFKTEADISEFVKTMDQEELDSLYRVDGEEYISIYTASTPV